MQIIIKILDTTTIILIAIGLSMDSFAVSITNGLVLRRISTKSYILIPFSFAIFQALMPLAGWYAGVGIEKYIREIDHWLAFGLLSAIGIKMIYEGAKKSGKISTNSEIKIPVLIGQSIATSIDAFIVGISIALLNYEIIKPVLIIGSTTLLFSFAGLRLGKYFGKIIGKKIEILGGVALIGIGLKILIEHLIKNI